MEKSISYSSVLFSLVSTVTLAQLNTIVSASASTPPKGASSSIFAVQESAAGTAVKKGEKNAKKASKAGKETKLVPFPGFLMNNDYGQIDHDRYNIDLAFGVANLATVDAFVRARDRWMNVITGDVPNVDTSQVDTVTVLCNPPDIVDDLHVCILEFDADGPGGGANFLAATYNTFVREGTSQTILSVIEFDSYDASRLIKEGCDQFALFLMGKSIGFDGLLYLDEVTDYDGDNVVSVTDDDDDFTDDFTNDDSTDDFTGVDVNYIGHSGNQIWQEWGCVGTPPLFAVGGGIGYNKVAYWDATCLVDELMSHSMTYFPDQTPTAKLSKLTIAAFEDMGYDVNYSAADKYNGGDTTCCNTNTATKVSSSKPSQPTLSQNAKEYAIAHGLKLLNKWTQVPVGISEKEEGVAKKGGTHSVTVVIEENGYIHSVDVTNP